MVDAHRLVTFIETATFARSATFLTDADRRALEASLLQNPRAGQAIPGCGGFRKIRVGREGQGKQMLDAEG